MKIQFLIIVILVGVVMSNPVCANSSVISNNYSLNIDNEDTISPLRWVYGGLAVSSPDGYLHINMEVTSGHGIDVYVLDFENLNAFENSQYYTYVANYQNQISLVASVSIPIPGTWYVVFYNPNPSSSCSIQWTIGTELTQMPSFMSSVYTISIFVVVLVSFGIIWKIVRIHKKRAMLVPFSEK